MFNKKDQKVWVLVDQHYNNVYECYVSFEKFLGDYLACCKPEALFEEFGKIDTLERQADQARRDLVNAFLEGYMLPTTRKEILQIVENIDKLANKCQDISRQLIFENVSLPDMLKTGLLEITRVTKEQFDLMSKALEILFSDYDQLIKDNSLLHDIKVKESDVDTVELELIKKLFASDLSLAEKDHFKYFISRVADISDLLEDIADQVQIMVVLRKV